MDRLSVREVRVLVALARSPGMGLTELSRSLGIPPSSMHGVLTKLQALDLVEKRNSNYYLTKKGEEMLETIKTILAVEVRPEG